MNPHLYLSLTAVAILAATWFHPAELEVKTGCFPQKENIAALPGDTITNLAPLGEYLPDSNLAIVFEWEPNFQYNGTYTLRVAELDSNDVVPDSLPATGLFYSNNDISGTSFAYPSNAPAFQQGYRYAWEVETNGLVNGKKVKGPVVIFIPSKGQCSISIAGVPTAKLCPGECFTMQVNLPISLLPQFQHQFTVYTDHPDPSSVTINGMSAYPETALCGATGMEVPQATKTGGTTHNLDICFSKGSPTPVHFSLYYNRPSSFCNADQCGTGCCHDIKTFSVDVADYPNFDDIELTVEDFGFQPVTEVVSGQPLHFAILNVPPGKMPVWECRVGSGPWQVVAGPKFNTLAFTTEVGHPALTLDCANSTSCFQDKTFRAKFTETALDGTVCDLYTNEYPLRICCPLSPATLDVSPGALLCEDTPETFNVSLSSPDICVQTPGDYVHIHWTFNGLDIGFADQSSFNYAPIAWSAGTYCFEATITNCANQKQVATKCVVVDMVPKCVPVIGDSPNLMEDLSTIDPYDYFICPNNDAVVVAVGYDKNNSNIVWESSADNSSWMVTGSSSNGTQNTNILFPPNTDCVYYRAIFNPLSNPSGCEPCTSNVVKICVIDDPEIPVLDVPTDACKEDLIDLTVTNPQTGVDYTWYCNGLPIGTGNQIQDIAIKDACYFVEAKNACTTIESMTSCVKVCETVAAISCPLPPNECACIGLPIEITAAYSYSTCPPGTFTYNWQWLDINNNPQTATTVSITDIPPASGTNYSVTVTDTDTGCSDTAEFFLKPCDKN